MATLPSEAKSSRIWSFFIMPSIFFSLYPSMPFSLSFCWTSSLKKSFGLLMTLLSVLHKSRNLPAQLLAILIWITSSCKSWLIKKCLFCSLSQRRLSKADYHHLQGPMGSRFLTWLAWFCTMIKKLPPVMQAHFQEWFGMLPYEGGD